MNTAFLRILLIGTLAAMSILALCFLRRRRLSQGEYLLWGLCALLIPALGPFLVILLKPGKPFLRR